MLHDGENATTEMMNDELDTRRRSHELLDWRQIDLGLREVAKRRGVLDAEEAVLLRGAVRTEIWRELGKASLLDYLEEMLGYSPRAAKERVRVAMSLDELPELADALETAELSYSAIRELTRVATPMTEREWRDEARGKNLRQIEERVSTRKRGDKPSDPPDYSLRPRVLRFEVKPATFALLRQAQQVLDQESGLRLDDDGLIAALCGAVLDGGGASQEEGRARHQIMTVVCEACDQGFQEAAGIRIPIEPCALAIAQCDAQRLGSDRAPERAVQDVPPKTQRFVRRRDGGRCCVPGCRSARFLDIHHVVPRELGGSHDASNICLLCGAHHRHLHEGKLTISGKAPDLEIRWAHHEAVAARSDAKTHVGQADAKTHVGINGDADDRGGRSTFDLVQLKIEAKQGLVKLKFSKSAARDAVEAAAASLGTNATIETLLFASLRQLSRSG